VRVISGEFETSSSEYVCGSPLCVSCGFITPYVTVSIRFKPTTLGPQTGKIVVENLAGCLGPGASAICDTVTVTGTGVIASPPSCGVSTNTIDMGVVYFGTSKDTTLTIRNVGGGTLSGSVAFLDNSPPFSLIGNTNYILGPQASQDFTIRFTSSGTAGHTFSYVGNLSTGTQCSSQGLDVQVTATAMEAPPPPSCAVSPTLLDFGTVLVGQSKDLTFDVRNSGGETLCGTITESCADFDIFPSLTYCITPPGFIQRTVRFTPTTTGFQQCTISPGTGCAPITVRGTGG
jgi:hypothetical protein